MPVLVNRLMELGYAGLFQGRNESALDAIWNEPGAAEALAALAVAPATPLLARFLAAETLFLKDEEYPPEGQKERLASAYAAALTQGFTGAANPWGLPGVIGGLAGEHFVALGEAAIPELISLLDDDSPVYYVGSEEATIGNSYEYRVKDLAGSFISRIRTLPLAVHASPEPRDKEIEKLKNMLK